MRVMTLNLAHGRKTRAHQALLWRRTLERNLSEIAELLRREAPDVVALQEADAPSLWSGRFDHVRHLAILAGYPHRLSGEHFCIWRRGRRICYGCSLLSRVPLAEAVSHKFRRTLSIPKWFVSAALRHPGQRSPATRVVSVHLDFARRRVRRKQVEALAAELAGDGPLIVMGDFNCQWLGREETLRQLAAGLGLHPFEPESDELPTFPSRRPRRRLDWILVSRHFEFGGYRALPERVSDHLAVVADLKRTSRLR